jgi:hypothetical protein
MTLRTSEYNEWWSYEGFLVKNPDKNKLDRIDLRNIRKILKPTGNPLEFQVCFTDMLLKPFMNYGKGELYYMYLDQ